MQSYSQLGREVPALNYLSQLRPYSYVDLLLLWTAIGATLGQMVAASLFWFGFLIHLEWRHKDNGRCTWHWTSWAILWTAGAALQPDPRNLAFLGLAVAYSFKKQFPYVAAVSFVFNGALKAALIIAMDGATTKWVLIVFGLTSIRNLAGDFRDITKDRSEGVRTLPVIVGLHHDIKWLYPALLGVTSLTWTMIGGIQPVWLVLALFVEAATYPLTPR